MQSANRAGVEAIGIDYFGDIDARKIGEMFVVSLDKRDWRVQFDQALKNENGSNDLFWMYAGGLENEPELIKEISERITLLGCRKSSVKKCRDPFLLQKLLIDNGHADGACSVRSLHEEVDPKENWLIKPFRSAGGQSIQQFDLKTKLKEFNADEFYLQAFQEGEVYSSVFIANQITDIRRAEIKYLGTTKQLENQQQGILTSFQYTGSIGPVSLTEILLEKIQSIATLFTNHFDLEGLFGIDYIVADECLKILEVNPRYPASAEVLERTSGQSFVGLALNARFPESIPLSDSTKNSTEKVPSFVGKKILYAESQLKVPDQWDWNEYRKLQKFKYPQIEISDLPVPKSIVVKGQPICTILYFDDDIQKCEERLSHFSFQKLKEFHSQWIA